MGLYIGVLALSEAISVVDLEVFSGATSEIASEVASDATSQTA
ncbi:MAG: hypothetical protein RR385_05460 [Clostridiales bacterium]